MNLRGKFNEWRYYRRLGRNLSKWRARIEDLKKRESLLEGGKDEHTRRERKRWREIYAMEREWLEFLVGDRNSPTMRCALEQLKRVLGVDEYRRLQRPKRPPKGAV